MNTKRVAARASGLRRDFHVAVAVACLRLRPLRFCGLHAGADRFSGCVPAYRARRAAIPLALRGKARRTHVTDGRRTCAPRSLAARRAIGKHGNNLE